MRKLLAGAGAMLVIVLTAVSITVFGAPRRQVDAGSGGATESACASIVTRTIDPDHIRLCEQSTVTIGVIPYCLGDPLNVVLVVDGYYGTSRGQDWAAAVVDALALSAHPSIRVGVISYYRSGSALADLTNDEALVLEAIKRIPLANDFYGTDLCQQCVFQLATKMLRGSPRKSNVIVFIGFMWWQPDPDIPHYTRLYNDWFDAVRMAKAAADPFVIGCSSDGIGPCRTWASNDWWREASPGYFFDGLSPHNCADAMGDLAQESAGAVISGMSVGDAWPQGLEYVPDSAAPAPAAIDPGNRRLRWDATAPITQPFTLTYKAQPLALGRHEFSGGQGVLTDTLGLSRVLPLPTGVLTVTGPCITPTAPPTDTATPPPTPTPTSTMVASATASATPTDVPTASPTPTAPPRPLYLPLLLGERCVPEKRRVDVALVIDASTSMLDPTRTGGTKLAAAVSAAGGFLDELRFEEGDQAAIIAFNADAHVLQGLTSDRRLLDEALGRIETASTTRLDLAVAAGRAVLTGPEHRSDNATALVLLTDGRANPIGPEVAVARAGEAKAAGITVFTIGLGEDLDVAALGAIASEPGYFYHAPDAADLAAIYRAIAVELPCPGREFWAGR